MNNRRRRTVGKTDFDAVALDFVQNIQQVAEVIADFQRFAVIFGLNFFHCRTQIGTGSRNRNVIFVGNHFNRAGSLGNDRNAVNCRRQFLNAQFQNLVVISRNDALIIRISAVNQFRGQRNVFHRKADFVFRKGDGNVVG